MKALTAWEKINLVRSFDDGSINCLQKFLLLTIATHLGDNDFCFLSITTLMRECAIKKRHTVIDNLKILAELNLIQKINPSQGYRSNRYLINFSEGSPLKGLLTQVVPHKDQGSPSQGLDQSLTGTSVVPHRDPNRNINNIEKKIKKKRVPRPLVRSLSKSQKLKAQKEAENYEKCANCQRPKLHCECKNGKDKWAPEMREGWDKMMEKLKIQ
jgi:hypothetical protein